MTTRWNVFFERGVEKQLARLPIEVRTILDELREDLALEGPNPKGWIVKHVHGQPGVFAVRLKREYRALYRFAAPDVLILHVSHRREAY